MNTDLMMRTCCFTGHREIEARDEFDLKFWLHITIQNLYRNYGVRFFGTGGERGFDILASEEVLRIQHLACPDVKLILVLSCPEQADKWTVAQRAKLESIKRQASKVVTVCPHYTKDCMLIRNRHLVDSAGYCIAYQRENTGTTAYTTGYAKELGRSLFVFGEDT